MIEFYVWMIKIELTLIKVQFADGLLPNFKLKFTFLILVFTQMINTSCLRIH